MAELIDISDIDIVFISYDEPNADKNWIELKKIAPWAKRVHGIKGSDSSHKEAAKISETERVITVDGDNQINSDFLDQTLKLNDVNFDHVFSWRSLNVINNLYYGNGGIKCWPVKYIMNMNSHENSLDNNPASKIEFCWQNNYTQMFNIYSKTHINGSAYQAWRAGYREGIKLVLNKGNKPNKENFLDEVYKRNLDIIKIWMTIGYDVPNGEYAMLGARQGLYDLMIEEIDYTNVYNFDWLMYRFERCNYNNDIIPHLENLGNNLSQYLDINVPVFDKNQSLFFRNYYKIPKNKEFMLTERESVFL